MTSSSNSSTGGNPLAILTDRLVTEWAGFGARERSAEARTYREAQGELWSAVAAVGRTREIDTILTAERAILDIELRQYGNSAGVRQSVSAGLAELTGAEHHLEIVRSPDRYRSLDKLFQRPRHRRQGLPDDEARQFFRAHNARLLNQDHARLTNEEKRTLEARRQGLFQVVGHKPFAARTPLAPAAERSSAEALNEATGRAVAYAPSQDNLEPATCARAGARALNRVGRRGEGAPENGAV